VPYATGHGGDSLLRLSWSGRPQRIERCRELSDAELAERPAHMRLRPECEARPARYAVRVVVDGRTASLDTVTGGGLRGDRAIHPRAAGGASRTPGADRSVTLAPGSVVLVTYDPSRRRLVLLTGPSS
jgi:hypothetical protein